MSLRGYPRSRVRVTSINNGPNAATVAMVGALDAHRGLAVAGLLGHRLLGMKGDPSVSHRGELGPKQQFRGWSGPPRGLMPGSAMSLPMTGAPDSRTGPFKAPK
jgi:hypothetical protein